MKRFYLGILFSDSSILEFNNLLTFRQATRKRLAIMRSNDNAIERYVVCTVIANKGEHSQAQRWLYEEYKKLQEREC